jgi:acyl carrier protein
MTNKTEEISPRIRRFIIEHFPLARKEPPLEDESPLLNSGIIDSQGVLEVISFIEEEFKITISDEDLRPENFESIASMVTYVQSKRNG